MFTTCTVPQVAVFQYAPHGTPTSHTHHPRRKTPTPHELFHLPGMEEKPIHISTPSLLQLTTHETTNPEPAEPKTTPSNLQAFP
jgi:hypothetical protein